MEKYTLFKFYSAQRFFQQRCQFFCLGVLHCLTLKRCSTLVSAQSGVVLLVSTVRPCRKCGSPYPEIGVIANKGIGGS